MQRRVQRSGQGGVRIGVTSGHPMLLLPPPCPLCPVTAASLAGLKATVLLLMVLLVKARIQIRFFSALGVLLLVLQTLAVVAAGGLAGTALLAGLASGWIGKRSAVA